MEVRRAIARALYKKHSFLILDEATSSVDLETEKNILNNIVKDNPNLTVIMIAHRLQTLEKCNYILEIKNKKIIKHKKILKSIGQNIKISWVFMIETFSNFFLKILFNLFFILRKGFLFILLLNPPKKKSNWYFSASKSQTINLGSTRLPPIPETLFTLLIGHFVCVASKLKPIFLIRFLLGIAVNPLLIRQVNTQA